MLVVADARSRSEAAKSRQPSAESSGLRRDELIWRSALLRRAHRERWSSGNRPKGTRRPARALSRIGQALTVAPGHCCFLPGCSCPFAEGVNTPCVVIEVLGDRLERRRTAVGARSPRKPSA